MKNDKCILSSLPNDVTFKIFSLLQVSDLCSLGRCSRFWREQCGSDSVWQTLCKDRWPMSTIVLDNQDSEGNPKSWRVVYARKHVEMMKNAKSIVDFVKHSSSSYESIEGGHYLESIESMCSMQFEFQDVRMFFLKPKVNVMLNLIGLYYCIMLLHVPAKYMESVLNNENIQSKEVCVQWWKIGIWNDGYRSRDEIQSRDITLADLTTAKGKQVLAVLHRGPVHEVYRVKITFSKPSSTPWSCHYMLQHN